MDINMYRYRPLEYQLSVLLLLHTAPSAKFTSPSFEVIKFSYLPVLKF